MVWGIQVCVNKIPQSSQEWVSQQISRILPNMCLCVRSLSFHFMLYFQLSSLVHCFQCYFPVFHFLIWFSCVLFPKCFHSTFITFCVYMVVVFPLAFVRSSVSQACDTRLLTAPISSLFILCWFVPLELGEFMNSLFRFFYIYVYFIWFNWILPWESSFCHTRDTSKCQAQRWSSDDLCLFKSHRQT